MAVGCWADPNEHGPFPIIQKSSNCLVMNRINEDLHKLKKIK
jgi:hypothetical protein